MICLMPGQDVGKLGHDLRHARNIASFVAMHAALHRANCVLL